NYSRPFLFCTARCVYAIRAPSGVAWGPTMLLRKFLITVGMVALMAAAGAQTLPATPVSLNIPRQALSDALNEFARQAKLRVAFYSTESEGYTSPALSGTYTPKEA